MKLAEISPIYKKNDSLRKENYRSVNLLVMISKVFERILADQLTAYFEHLLSGVPDYFYRNKISSGGDLSHYSSALLY